MLFLWAVLAGTALFWAPSPAQASFTLTISDGTNSVTVNDNNSPAGSSSGATGLPLDLDGQSGSIIYSGSVGVFNINITTGTSNAPGTPSLAQLTINNTSITSAGFLGTKTLTFTLADDGFTSPTGNNLLLQSQVSTTQLPANTNVTYQSYVDLTPGTPLSLNTVGGAIGFDSVNVTNTSFTLTSVTTFTLNGTGAMETVQFTGLTALAVPGPAGAVLALVGIPSMGIGCWLRRRKAT